MKSLRIGLAQVRQTSDFDENAGTIFRFLEKAAAIPASLDLANTKRVGPFGMLPAGFNPEVKEGLGVMMALTKAMGKMKTNGDFTDSQADASPST